MFHAHAPGVGPYLFEGFQEARNGQRYFVLPHAAERVVPESEPWIAGVEIYETFRVGRCNAPGKLFHQVSVRITSRSSSTAIISDIFQSWDVMAAAISGVIFMA